MDSLYEVIYKNTNVGLILVDTHSTKILKVNPRAKEILGYEVDDKFSFQDLIIEKPEDGLVVLNNEKLKYDNFYHEMTFKLKDGSQILVEMNVKLINYDTNHYSLLTFRDVTFDIKLRRDIEFKQEELMTAIEQINKQNNELKSLDKAKDKFLALITHELRTPLSAILATADLLHNKLYEPEQLQEFIDMIYSEGKHLSAIVNDILDFSKIQAGKMEFYVQENSPLNLLKDQIKNFEAMATEKNVTLKLIKNIDVKCFFDPLRLNQVIANIINNGIKFNKVSGSLTVAIEEKNDFVCISFKDEGIGIAEDKKNSIFNEFETLENINTHHKGTGLGMSISKKLIEGMGGKIHFESTLNVGTTFFIEIPNKKVLPEGLYRSRPDENGDILKTA